MCIGTVEQDELSTYLKKFTVVKYLPSSKYLLVVNTYLWNRTS